MYKIHLWQQLITTNLKRKAIWIFAFFSLISVLNTSKFKLFVKQ